MSFSTTRTIIAIAALADLTATMMIIISYHEHASDLNFTLEFTVLPWQVLHVFSWFGALLYSTGGLDQAFGRVMLGTYIGVLFGDIISLLLRIFLVPNSVFFIQIAFWATLILCLVDLMMQLFLWISVITTDIVGDDETEEEDEDGPVVENTPKISRYTKPRDRTLSWLWIFELILIISLFFVYSLGLNRSPSFSRIIMLEALHAFIWLLHLAIAERNVHENHEKEWYRFSEMFSALMVISGVCATILRSYYIFTDSDEPATLIPSLVIYSGWIQLSLGTGLLAVSLAQFLVLAPLTSKK